MGDESEHEDLRTNVLRLRKLTAAGRADQAPGNLTPAGGHPLAGSLAALEQAWVSPARERTVFVEALEGAGAQVPAAFDAQAALCRSEAAAEPHQVDADDPVEGWKAFGDRIDARRSYPGYGR